MFLIILFLEAAAAAARPQPRPYALAARARRFEAFVLSALQDAAPGVAKHPGFNLAPSAGKMPEMPSSDYGTLPYCRGSHWSTLFDLLEGVPNDGCTSCGHFSDDSHYDLVH